MTKEQALKKAFYIYYKENKPDNMYQILEDGGYKSEEINFKILDIVAQFRLFYERKIFIAKKNLQIQPISLIVVLVLFYWLNDGRVDNWQGKLAIFFIGLFCFNILKSIKTLYWDVKNYKPRTPPKIIPS